MTHRALDSWDNMSAADIGALLPPKPGPILRFTEGLKRLQRSQNSFSRNNCSKILFELTHILAPHWSSGEPCVICAKLLRLSSEPRNLARRCPTPHDIPVATPNQWHQEFGAMIQSVCHTVEKLRDQFALRVLVQEGAPVTLLLFARPDVQSASPPNPILII